MEKSPQKVYVRGERVPFEEDILHELKGHRTINLEESNPHHYQETKDGKRMKRTRQQWSKYLCGMLNSGQGGTLYSGILDDGVVSGLMLTKYQQLHVELSLRDTLNRFNPPVSLDQWRLEFIPVLEPDETCYIPDPSPICPHLWHLDHKLRTYRYCWCDCNALAEFGMGVIFPFYIIQVRILPWRPASNPVSVDQEIPPLYLAEDGECYIRKHATTERYSPVEMRELNEERMRAAYSRMEAREKLKLEASRVALASEGTKDTDKEEAFEVKEKISDSTEDKFIKVTDKISDSTDSGISGSNVSKKTRSEKLAARLERLKEEKRKKEAVNQALEDLKL